MSSGHREETLSQPLNEMKICSFLWVYYGYPTSTYEGINVENMRYECGKKLAQRDAQRDDVNPDLVAGVPDSGIAHAIGYANESGIPFSRPFIKYTPTWPRSFMPSRQEQRNLIARMKLIPVEALIKTAACCSLMTPLSAAHSSGKPQNFCTTAVQRKFISARPARHSFLAVRS